MISRSLKFVLTGTSFNYFRIHTLILTRWVYFRITVISLDTERSSRRLWYLLKYDELMRDAGYLSFFLTRLQSLRMSHQQGTPYLGAHAKIWEGPQVTKTYHVRRCLYTLDLKSFVH